MEEDVLVEEQERFAYYVSNWKRQVEFSEQEGDVGYANG